MKRQRLVFFGTPEFAVPTLVALCEGGRRPEVVVSQPARPSGRGRRLREPPVASWSQQQGMELLQPRDVRATEFLDRLEFMRPTVAVVVAFGQIFPKKLLDLPTHGCMNLHPSLLPRYRGAAPIPAAIIAGETRTGVTTMLMDEGLDSGPILLQEETEIGPQETAGQLATRLAQQGATLVLRTLEQLEQGRLEPRPQLHAEATVARRLRRSDGEIDWGQDAGSIFNQLRGLTPWPGVRSSLRGRPVKILWGRPLVVEGASAAPGSYLGLHERYLLVRCGGETVFGVEELQRPGRRPVSAVEFVNGEHLEAGDRFG